MRLTDKEKEEGKEFSFVKHGRGMYRCVVPSASADAYVGRFGYGIEESRELIGLLGCRPTVCRMYVCVNLDEISNLDE